MPPELECHDIDVSDKALIARLASGSSVTRVSLSAAELMRLVTGGETSFVEEDVTVRGHELQLLFMRTKAIDTLADINKLRDSISQRGAALKRLACACINGLRVRRDV